MGAKSITVFLDACFTGQTRSEEMLVADTRPITIVPIEKNIPQTLRCYQQPQALEVAH